MARGAFDVIVVGSGFGGAVIACRLAERGQRVLVLERGRRWDPADYPRGVGDAWVWDQYQPQRYNGWLDFRFFGRMAVAQGAGVGGGSLAYANVSVDAGTDAFDAGWPPEITAEALAPYYARVGRMLDLHTLPEGQLTARYRLTREAAERAGHGARFRALPLAVSFDPEWHYGLDDPFAGRHAKPWVNAEGQLQGTCVHCGNCDIGCQVRAKNTLDLNYLPRAERHGAEIRPLHLVTAVALADDGYVVHFDRIERGRRIAGRVRGTRVVVAAGSLGSTELLLRCRDEHRTLPGLSARLGHQWSSNGDFLTPALYADRVISPTQGPTITCAVDFLDGARGSRFFIEDGGVPNLIDTLRAPGASHGRRTTIMHGVVDAVRGGGVPFRTMTHPFALARLNPALDLATRALGYAIGMDDPMRGMMPWFAQGVDGADGRLYLGRRARAPWRRALRLRWDVRASSAVIDAIIAMHRELTEATGGRLRVPASWRLMRTLVTPHPLGGCSMGETPADGVVDHRGAVFGYPGLYVADGAVVPRAIGLNPSKTIAALAERTAELMPG